MSQYLDSVREVERRIQKAEQQRRHRAAGFERPTTVPAVWEDHVKLMFDLQVLALQTDMTRVITFQLARETSTRTYPHRRARAAPSGVAPYERSGEAAKLAKINAHHVSLFAYLVEKLQATPDGDGSLLDHSIYLLGSGMAIRISTITRTCRSFWPAGETASSRARVTSSTSSPHRWRISI